MMRWFSILLAVSPAVALLVPAVRNLLPAAMHAPGPAGLEWWRWIAIPGAVAISGALGIALGWLTRATMTRLAARTSTIWDDQLLGRIAGPITLAWTVAGIYVMLPLLDLPPGAHNGALSILRITLLVDFFWALLRLIEVGGRFLLSTPWATENAGSRALLPLIVRVSKVVVLIIGAVAVFAELGYPVASLIAGLGIGGLAFALAAQKTIENLFGAFSIGFDQPIREGDFVKIEDFVGTVEAIGLRSTRIRTLDRTIISLPNGRLAEMRLESFAVRDRLRLACVVSVVYGSTAAQVRLVLEGLERVLRAHPRIWPDAVVVKLMALGKYAIEIEVMAWFQTRDWGEFQGIRQEILLAFMDVVERSGTQLALPTQTLHVAPTEHRAVA